MGEIKTMRSAAGPVFFGSHGSAMLDESGSVDLRFRDEADKAAFLGFMPTLATRESVTVPFPYAQGTPLSLSIVEFGPGYLLPLHSHAVDCLYYIERGSITMGARILGAGEGFFIGSGQPYGYRVGADGVKLLEFRSGAVSDFTLLERDVPGWTRRWQASVDAVDRV